MQLDVEVSPPALYCKIWICGFPLYSVPGVQKTML